MCSASVEVIFESGQTLSQDVEYFTHRNNASSTYTLPHIDMSVVPIVAMVLTIGKLDFLLSEKNCIISFKVSKAILFVLCYRIKNPTMSALAEDSRNDVASNIVALVCGLLGMIIFHIIHNRDRQTQIDCIFS
jgi:hypothetical protein